MLSSPVIEDSFFPSTQPSTWVRTSARRRRLSSQRGGVSSPSSAENESLGWMQVKVSYPPNRSSIYSCKNVSKHIEHSFHSMRNTRKVFNVGDKGKAHSMSLFTSLEEGNSAPEERKSRRNSPHSMEVHVNRNPFLCLPSYDALYRQQRTPRNLADFVKSRKELFSHVREGDYASLVSDCSFQPSVTSRRSFGPFDRRTRRKKDSAASAALHKTWRSSGVEIPKRCPDDLLEGLEDRTWTPGKTLRVSYVTWNMACKEPSAVQLSSGCIHPNGHVIVIATQENGPYIGSNRFQQNFEKIVVEQCLKGEYVVVTIKKMWALHLMVLARKRDVALHIAHVETAKVTSGLLGIGGNKGAVAVALSIRLSHEGCGTSHNVKKKRRTTANLQEVNMQRNYSRKASNTFSVVSPVLTMLFINAHLPAHMEGMKKRNSCYHKILKTIKVGKKGVFAQDFRGFDPSSVAEPRSFLYGTPQGNPLSPQSGGSSEEVSCGASATSQLSCPPSELKASIVCVEARNASDEFDITFFGGDLNYRIEEVNERVEKLASHPALFNELVALDQLLKEKNQGLVFKNFREGTLKFPPTYKYEIPKEKATSTVGVHAKKTLLGYAEASNGKKARVPSYCDRVLFRTPPESKVSKADIELYTDVQGVTSSDHRPVVAIFDISTKTTAAL